MSEQKVWVEKMPESCSECEWCTLNHNGNYGRPVCSMVRMPLYNGDKIKEERGQHKDSLSDFDCPLHSIKDHDRELVKQVCEKIKQQLAEKEKMHLLDEKEFQYYCAYKQIEPEIKGCLDRERDYKKQLAEKDKEIESIKQQLEETNAGYDFTYEQSRETIKELKQNQTKLAIQELEKLRNKVIEKSEKIVDTVDSIQDFHSGITLGRFKRIIDDQIKKLRGIKD